MMQCLGSLVPGLGSASPAYFEPFPEKAGGDHDRTTRKPAVTTAVADAVTDVKCATIFEQSTFACASCSSSVATECTPLPSKTDSPVASSWLEVG